MDMEFTIIQAIYSGEYYIYFCEGKGSIIMRDPVIAKLLDMTLEEYEKLALSYGANNRSSGLVFKNKNDAQKFADYLNDKYLVILKLSEKV